MGKMGRYCRAYPLASMRQFDGWHEDVHAFRKREDGAAGAVASSNGDRPDNDHIVYLQENYTVTDGIFLDENVIFDDVTPAWLEFCRATLNFEVPNAEAAAQTIT